MWRAEALRLSHNTCGALLDDTDAASPFDDQRAEAPKRLFPRGPRMQRTGVPVTTALRRRRRFPHAHGEAETEAS